MFHRLYYSTTLKHDISQNCKPPTPNPTTRRAETARSRAQSEASARGTPHDPAGGTRSQQGGQRSASARGNAHNRTNGLQPPAPCTRTTPSRGMSQPGTPQRAGRWVLRGTVKANKNALRSRRPAEGGRRSLTQLRGASRTARSKSMNQRAHEPGAPARKQKRNAGDALAFLYEYKQHAGRAAERVPSRPTAPASPGRTKWVIPQPRSTRTWGRGPPLRAPARCRW